MGLFKRKKKEEKKEDQVKKPEKVKIDKKDEKEIKSVKKDKKLKNESYKYLIKPIDTEKSKEIGVNNQYVFEVHPKSNKIEIKKAIEAAYGVKPVKVNIINVRGKRVRYGRQFGRTKHWKKAIVTLKQGERIEVYEGV